MNLQPYLYFDGRCREAFTFYQQMLGGEIATMLRFGDRPEDLAPPEWNDKILHATLKIGDQALLGADVFPGGYTTPRGFGITIALHDLDQAKRIFDALAEGGNVTMPLQETFWSNAFGMVTDRFGIPWIVNCG